MCKYKGEIHSEPDESNKMETNQCAVADTIVNGGSYAQIKEFLAAMNIPVESFNGIIAKYTGGKRLNFGERGSYTGRMCCCCRTV